MNALRLPISSAVAALVLSLALLPLAHAADEPANELPPESLVRQSILAMPEVKAATAALQADQAEADRLRAGPHEFTLRLQGQQRRVNEPQDGVPNRQRYGEYQLALERTLRGAGKAAQDEAIGEATLAAAQIRRSDAIHEASRALLRAWIDWLREGAIVEFRQKQAADQAELTRIAATRVKAGDAARNELRLQEANAAQAQAELATALAREAAARAGLDARYPGLAPVRHAALAVPRAEDLPAGSGESVRSDLEERSHEWRLARQQATLAEARALRTALEHRVDPTVGLYAGVERGGAERIVGVSLSLPLAGAARQAAERQARAQADQAGENARAIQQKVHAEAAIAWTQLRSTFEGWQRQEAARRQHEDVLQATVRGWRLGEYGQADVLLARRQFTEAALAEITARAEARHAALRLRLDLHQSWEFDEN
ncbi:MAG: TolC family protein [Variovorax sp.]|nr:TolC family protein [Variovorax sp.]